MGKDTPKVVSAAADGEAASSPRTRTEAAFGFACKHPFMTFLLLCALGLLCLAGVWTYLRLTTEAHIRQELRARGLPTSGLELETWNHPADDGKAEFLSALKEMETLSARTNFDRLINELKPEQFSANEAELNALLRDFEPIRQRMQNAAQHEAITYGGDYRNLMGMFSLGLMQYRTYHLTLVQQARQEWCLRNNSAQALRTVRDGFRLTQKLRTYTLIESLVSIAANGVDAKAAAEVLDTGVNDAALLRELAGMLASPQTAKAAAANARNGYVGEAVLLVETAKSLRLEWSSIAWALSPPTVAGYELPGELRAVQFGLLFDIDLRLSLQDRLQLVDIAMRPYPSLREQLDFIRARDMQAYNVRAFLTLNSLVGNLAFLNSLIQHFKCNCLMAQLSAACLLAADRLEGKDWPVNLDDARFPRDPFTGLPFKLIVNKDAVLIYSLGPDQTDSGKVAAFNQTGDMGGSYIASPGSDDDIVFRLARQPYDAAASAPASIPKP